MNDVASSLRIKYGLGVYPEAEEIRRWYRRTQEFIKKGQTGEEEAGQQAAAEVFRDFKTHVYKSEADTIAYLLAQLAEST